MKRLKLMIAAALIAVVGTFALVPVSSVGALDPLGDVCSDGSNNDTEVCKHQDEDAGSLINTLVNVLLFLAGTLSVIMIIVSGIWYITSGGDASKVTRAKNTLMYSIIGLVLSFIAYAVVYWVLGIFD